MRLAGRLDGALAVEAEMVEGASAVVEAAGAVVRRLLRVAPLHVLHLELRLPASSRLE